MKIKGRSLAAILFISLGLLITSCTAPTPPAAPEVPAAAHATVQAPVPTIASPAGPGPAETVSAFYNWYLAYTAKGGNGMRNALVDGAYADTGYITEALAERVRNAIAAPGGGFDPFLCGQDLPEQVLPSTEHEEGERAAVHVYTSFAGHRFTVLLVREGAAWRIDDVSCGGAEEPVPSPLAAVATVVVVVEPAPEAAGQQPQVPQGWQVYRNEEFRFQVGYPEGWVVREVAAVEGEPPIGPENMKLVLMLMPQAWAEQLDGGAAPDPEAPVLAPLTVEVTLGPEDAFWSSYPAQAKKAEVSLGSAQALRMEEVVADEISIPRYVYQHPVTGDLRVVLTDPISGFPDRRAAYPDAAAAFEGVANSFAWLD